MESDKDVMSHEGSIKDQVISDSQVTLRKQKTEFIPKRTETDLWRFTPMKDVNVQEPISLLS